ncbi:hypothetical protein PWYN_23585 [Paenibacillus wynnii]|uniref:Uncharacterized protein n=1 Tax=Paenibacillus wynnii TaxID=268407 RepID=A0A098M6B6_9BACL|nr:hypothetical protein PWYN_23585 [Paenibacillus wynnii]
MFITIGTFGILYRDGIYKTENAATSVPLLRELLKTMATMNITIALGLAALLFSIITVNNKVNTNSGVKKDVITISRPYLMFLLLNSVIVMLSSIDLYVTSIVSVLTSLLVNTVLVLLASSVYKFMKKVLLST